MIASYTSAAGRGSKPENNIQQINTWTLNPFQLIWPGRRCLLGVLFGWWRFSHPGQLFPASSLHARYLQGLSLQSSAASCSLHLIQGRPLYSEVWWTARSVWAPPQQHAAGCVSGCIWRGWRHSSSWSSRSWRRRRWDCWSCWRSQWPERWRWSC